MWCLLSSFNRCSMCGLVGYMTKEVSSANQQQALASLIKESKIRGLHAFGAAYWDEFDAQIEVIKSDNLHTILHRLPLLPLYDAIFHARYSTSGDWQDMANNQPVVFDDVQLVWNGVISMKTKEEMEEEFDVELQSDNDGEVFIHKLLSGDLEDFFDNMTGAFAGIWYQGGVMYALRNERRPLWYTLLDKNTVVLASTNDIIKRALGVRKAQRAIPLEPYVLYDVEKDLLP